MLLYTESRDTGSSRKIENKESRVAAPCRAPPLCFPLFVNEWLHGVASRATHVHLREWEASCSGIMEFFNFSRHMWQQWVNGILGLWILLLPFVGLTGDGYLWALALSGVLIAILGFWGAIEVQQDEMPG